MLDSWLLTQILQLLLKHNQAEFVMENAESARWQWRVLVTVQLPARIRHQAAGQIWHVLLAWPHCWGKILPQTFSQQWNSSVMLVSPTHTSIPRTWEIYLPQTHILCLLFPFLQLLLSLNSPSTCDIAQSCTGQRTGEAISELTENKCSALSFQPTEAMALLEKQNHRPSFLRSWISAMQIIH